MKQALGLVEIEGLTTAVVVADTMAKAANVRILELENTKGLGYMTIKVAGDVGAVNAAVTAGKQIGMINQKLISWKVIPRPSDYVEQTFCCNGQPESAPPAGQKLQENAEQETREEAAMVEVKQAGEAVAEPEAQVQPPAETEPETAKKPEAAPAVEAEPEPEKTAGGKSEPPVKESGTKKRKK